MERYFNTTGPCIPGEHYMLPALDRLPGIRRLVSRGQYFVIHAPRQTGKTTALKALVREINAKGDMVALYCTLETLQNATDVDWAMTQVRGLLLRSATAVPEPRSVPSGAANAWCVREEAASYTSTIVSETLTQICHRYGKPLVVFFDEADCLFGNVLISFLRQLRDGYVNRDMVPFPASIALVGMLDVRDYKAQIRPDGESLGQISPFNIIAEDLMLRNFTEDEVAALYAQHTEATGQKFEAAALAKVWEFTRGQPWLVNAIARECVEELHDFHYGEAITADDIDAAKETIILENPIHLDYLYDMVSSEWVKPIVDAGLHGMLTDEQHEDVRFKFLMGLGGFCEVNGKFEFANPIYATYWRSRT